MPALPRHGQPGRSRWTAATRHGSRIAASPPGSGTGSSQASRSKLVEVAAEQLAAPERPVRAVARAVEDERERRALLAVLGEAGGRVRVVVLHADERKALLVRPLRREVLGMEVVGDHLGLDAEHLEVELEVVAKGAVGGLGVEVAEVGREEGARPRRDAEGALQLGAGGDERARAETGAAAPAGTKPRERRIGKPRADDRVLAAAVDRAVVGEEGVGDPAQPLAGLVVVERDRLVGAVAARHHERPAEVVAEQVVERGVGEHHAEPRDPGRDRLGDARVRRGAERARSAAARARAALAPRRRPPRAHPGRRVITRERLLLAVLARAQPRDRLLVRRVAGEVVAAEALDREDPAARGAARPPPRAASRAAGPQTGQAIGSAWKRRSPGPRTRAGSPAHIGKPAIVVFGRSYGTARTIVKRGPHWVQLTNG